VPVNEAEMDEMRGFAGDKSRQYWLWRATGKRFKALGITRKKNSCLFGKERKKRAEYLKTIFS
jgi:IS1 family transposase